MKEVEVGDILVDDSRDVMILISKVYYCPFQDKTLAVALYYPELNAATFETVAYESYLGYRKLV